MALKGNQSYLTSFDLNLDSIADPYAKPTTEGNRSMSALNVVSVRRFDGLIIYQIPSLFSELAQAFISDDLPRLGPMSTRDKSGLDWGLGGLTPQKIKQVHEVRRFKVHRIRICCQIA